MMRRRIIVTRMRLWGGINWQLGLVCIDYLMEYTMYESLPRQSNMPTQGHTARVEILKLVNVQRLWLDLFYHDLPRNNSG